MDIHAILLHIGTFLNSAVGSEIWQVAFMYMPFVLFLELPVYGLSFIGMLRHTHDERYGEEMPAYYPTVSCLLLCYSEGENVIPAIRSLAGQVYDGVIEIIVLVDGAVQNRHTMEAAQSTAKEISRMARRKLVLVPKVQRGGRVSSENLGLALAKGEIIMALDGDTSFDNDMVAKSVRHFADPSIVAVSGALRLRNAMKNLVTRFQGLEYLISIHAGRTGLSTYNLVNNVSGAFGVFRTSILRQIGGWSSGTAEDLDLTMRLNSYFARYPIRVVFEPLAVGHTDGPDTWVNLAKQRMRWDGDLVYVYLRKHLASFDSRQMGWAGLIYRAWTGMMFTIFTPLLIYGYIILVLFVYPAYVALSIAAMLLIFYSIVATFFYGAFLLLISERPSLDLKYLPLIPIFGFYTMFLRIVNAIAVIWNFADRAHLDSAMAPWWVLRKGKF